MYWYTLPRPSVSDLMLFKHFLATGPGHLEIEKTKMKFGGGIKIFFYLQYTLHVFHFSHILGKKHDLIMLQRLEYFEN